MSNTTSHNTIRAAATLVAALGSAAAFAHPGHQADATFIAGLLHPLSGLDHVLVIVAVSAWAALLPASARGLVAGCLALFVALGAAMPLAPAGRGLEAALALTVMGSGVLLAVGRRLPAYAAGALAGAFAWVHGLAHGTEGTAGSVAYIAGLAVTTAGLALVVTFAAAPLQARPAVLRAAGCLGALSGVTLLVGVG